MMKLPVFHWNWEGSVKVLLLVLFDTDWVDLVVNDEHIEGSFKGIEP
jgi:hypothetical protein